MMAGIPYVLEFWPPGSRSAVHNHGSVCAIVKVVFGTIQNGTYNKVQIVSVIPL